MNEHPSLAERLSREIGAPPQRELPTVDTIREIAEAQAGHENVRRADAINAMLRAKGVDYTMSPQDAERIWWIAETLVSSAE